MQSGQLLGDCCYTTGSVLLAPARKQFCQLSAQLLVAGLRRGPDVPFWEVMNMLARRLPRVSGRLSL